MTTVPVRIREETHETLRELKQQTGEPMPDLLARAVDQFYRSILIAETNIGYAELRGDSVAWDEDQAELALWDGTVADGVE